MLKLRNLCLLCFVVFVVGCANKSTDEPADNTFTLGLLPTDSATEMQPRADELARFLTTEMQQPVEVYIPNSYEALIEALRFGHVDAAFFDSGPAAIAHAQLGAEVVLAEVNNGVTNYTATLFVRSDETEITELDNVVGKKIAFTSWTGSSGFLYPIGTLAAEGLITPADDSLMSLQTALDKTFAEHAFSGGYEASLNLLLNGQADVIGGAHDVPERFLSEEDQKKVKKLLELGPVPSHPVVVRPDLAEGVRTSFVTAMLLLNNPENNTVLGNLYGVEGLEVADTKTHLGDFNLIVEALPAIQTKLLDKSH